jgi:hypothetical protein
MIKFSFCCYCYSIELYYIIKRTQRDTVAGGFFVGIKKALVLLKIGVGWI